jgi:hypothetical protein
MATYIGKSEIATRITVSQFFVIKPHQVKDGGMKVMDVDFVFDRFETEVIGCAVGLPTFNSATRHEHRKSPWVVITAISVFGGGSSAKLASPDDKGFVEKPPVFQIG